MDVKVARLREHGWRQGSIVRSGLEGLPEGIVAHADDRPIVISQDCDVVHRSLEVEPSVEVLIATLADRGAADAGLRYGRSPRRLDLVVEQPTPACLQLDIRRRHFIPRALLAAGPPECIAMGAEDVLLLADWLAKRYTRPAFPDAFNERLGAIGSKLEKTLKSAAAKHVTGLFLRISPLGECDEGKDYQVVLRFVAERDSFSDAATETALAGVQSKLEGLLGICAGIELRNCDLVSEAEFSLADLRHFRRSDFDYRSHSANPAVWSRRSSSSGTRSAYSIAGEHAGRMQLEPRSLGVSDGGCYCYS